MSNLKKVETEKDFIDAQQILEEINLRAAMGEDIQGDKEEYVRVYEAMSHSDYKFDMDTGLVIKKESL